MSDDRFVVEADRRVVGVAVKVRGGFKFFSSDPAYSQLEAKTFPRARAIAQRIAEIARTQRIGARRERATTPAVPH